MPKRKDCERLPLSMETRKRLWSESAGFCQKPDCPEYLYDDEADADFGEMAHIVPATSGGPRDEPTVTLTREERAHHSNIAVLCANCHTIVDKRPGRFPVSMMREWKASHQDKVRRALGTPKFETRSEARAFVEPLLSANRQIFLRYGPEQDNFSEERAAQWRRHVVGTVVPNNARIDSVLKQNRDLLRTDERETADLFSMHATEFAARHLLGDWEAGSLRFPEKMDSMLEDEA